MGMYDTLVCECPNCGNETYIQTKLGDCCLDYYKIGSKTTLPDGIYRSKHGCDNCGTHPTFVIVGGLFISVLKDAPQQAVQEMLFGGVKPLGTDLDEQVEQLAAVMRTLLDKFKKNKDKND